MRSILLLLFVFVAATLAGCTQTPNTSISDGETHVVTDPTDYSYVANMTDGSGWHVHDYWRRQERLTVLEERYTSAGSFWYTQTTGTPAATFRPAAGSTIPQGAAFVNVTIEWSFGSSDFDRVELWVRSADRAALEPVGQIHNGIMHAIASTNEANDPPHTQLSAWVFQVRLLPGPGQDEMSFSDPDIRITVTADRGLDIPAWPPHPDFWQGQDELELHQSTRDVALDYRLTTPTYTMSGCSGCLGRHTPDETTIVPYNADQIRVVLDLEPGSPNTLRLDYRGADTWNWSSIDPDEQELDRLVFVIPVSPIMADSPYAKNSLWEFQVVNPDIEGNAVWRGSYTITMTAHRG